ncbi:MAG: DNA polymerase III subunit epsilon [Waddliaceae bacterium]|nr:DNA polymerase III subunit epsilon [Waddliaceae bacterium]
MLGIFLDLECNGLNPRLHRAIEIAFRIINLKDGTELTSYHTVISQSEDTWKQSDPESIQVNGFTFEKILTGKPEEKVREDIVNLFDEYQIRRGKAVFICQNPSFDRAFFSGLIPVELQESKLWPYHWLDFASMYWALEVKNHAIPDQISLSKDKIAEQYQLPSEEKPHQAMNGVNHLILCYKKVVGIPQEKK